MNAQEWSLFNTGAKGELRTIGVVKDTMSEPEAEDLTTMYITSWLTPEIENFCNDNQMVDCLLKFRDWLKTNPVVVTSHITPVNITLTLVIPVGSGGAALHVSMSAIPSDDLNAAAVEVYDAIASMGMFLRSKRLASPAQPGVNSNGRDTAPKTERIPITQVMVEERNGTRYYRCAGGRWMKYGVACWPEVWNAAGINPETYQIGNNPANFEAVIAFNENGKPDKVTQIFSK